MDCNGSIGEKTDLVEDVLAATIGDQRVWYVIWNRQIFSRTYGWAPRPYTGSNPHDHHVHISLLHTGAAESDTSTWLLPEAPVKPVKVAPVSAIKSIKDAINAQIKAKPRNVKRKRKLQKARAALPKN